MDLTKEQIIDWSIIEKQFDEKYNNDSVAKKVLEDIKKWQIESKITFYDLEVHRVNEITNRNGEVSYDNEGCHYYYDTILNNTDEEFLKEHFQKNSDDFRNEFTQLDAELPVGAGEIIVEVEPSDIVKIRPIITKVKITGSREK